MATTEDVRGIVMEHAQRLAELEAKEQAGSERMGRMEQALDRILATLERMLKVPWWDPRTIVVLVALILGGSGFGMGVLKGDPPATPQAIQNQIDPATLARIREDAIRAFLTPPDAPGMQSPGSGSQSP